MNLKGRNDNKSQILAVRMKLLKILMVVEL